MLTDRGTEYGGVLDLHEYDLYLVVENIEHTRTRARSPQAIGICERFHKTMLNEFYRVAFWKKLYAALEELQADLDASLREYSEGRPHQWRWCERKTPSQTFLGTPRWRRESSWSGDGKPDSAPTSDAREHLGGDCQIRP